MFIPRFSVYVSEHPKPIYGHGEGCTLIGIEKYAVVYPAHTGT